jgi:DNA polymerase-4
VIAHVQLHDFFIAVERSARPDLAGRPILIGGLNASRGLVAAASPEARERGVGAGMRVADALAAVPDAACLPGGIERYLEVSAQIDERLRACTLAIEWTAIDEAWLQLDGGRASRAPSRDASLDNVRHALARDFGLSMAAGVGSTRAVAAVASRLMQPAGMLIVLPGYEARLLAPVDIRRLPGLSDEQQTRLRAAGVNSLGELAALDETLLHELIGRGGSVLARHALGLDDRPLAPADVPKGVARAALFGSCGGSQARGAVVRLAEQAGAALRRSGHGARQIRLRVGDAAGERMRAQLVDPPASTEREVVALADALALRLLHPGRDLFEAAVFLTALTPVDPQLQLNWKTA